MSGLEKLSMADLNIRREVLSMIIHQAKVEGDPRAVEPQRQLRIIVEEINRRKELPPPQNVGVGLDTLVLFAEKL